MELDSRQAGDGRRAYRIGWFALFPGFVGAASVLYASGMAIDSKAIPFCTLLALLFGAHFLYSRYRPIPMLMLATGSLTLMISSAFLAGIIANAGMRLRYPLIDASLSAADRLMGFDTAAIVRAIAVKPLLAAILNAAYSSIFPIIFVTAVVLSVLGHRQRLWELTVGFGAGILACAIASVLFPAIGTFQFYGLEGLSGNGLPVGAGVYHLHAVAAYRDGIEPLLDVRKLEGVVTFPSFHMMMAIIVGHAFRSTGIFGWIMSFWCVLVAISTIPMGGHYIVDLVGGTIVWGLLRWAWTERRVSVPHASYPLQAAPDSAVGTIPCI